MVQWTEIKDVAMTHPYTTKLLGDAKNKKAKGKGGAKGKKSRKCKRKEYDEGLFSRSEGEDNLNPEEGVGVATALPNILPLPGFLVAALMEAYTTDADILCLVAIDAIKKREMAAGADPADSTVAQKTAYVPLWIWNFATKQAMGPSIAPVSQRADLVWASGVHRRYFHPPSSGSTV
jgi:hypothetical protein